MHPPRLPEHAALFLDFDGVLVDIAARPDATVVPPALPRLLARLYDRQGGALALISGRFVADLRKFLPDFPGLIAGSHGAELARGENVTTAIGGDLDAAAMHEAAYRLAEGHDAILIETKPLGVAMHFRADPSLEEVVKASMQQLTEQFPGTKLQPAKMAIELQPDGVGKGGALALLMDEPPFTGRAPVYAGDDLTDEPAMAEAQSRGGFAIKIGEGESVADYRLAGPAEMAAWLDSAFQP